MQIESGPGESQVVFLFPAFPSRVQTVVVVAAKAKLSSYVKAKVASTVAKSDQGRRDPGAVSAMK